MSMNTLNERGRALEEDYFRRLERQQLEALRQQQEQDQTSEHEKLTAQTGIADRSVLQEMKAIGFTPATTSLLELVPMVQMAWAEGSVQGRERKEIIEVARRRGIALDGEAFAQLTEWLEHRPSDEFFERTLRVLKCMLESLPEGERDVRQQAMLAHCYRVAKAAGGGGFINFGGRVCEEENAVFDRIIHSLTPETVAPSTHDAA